MESGWKPTPGQVAMIELTGEAGGDCVTGVVVSNGDRLVVDVGGSARAPKQCEVIASFFAPDALYRMSATASPAEGGVIDLAVHDVERVQRRAAPRARLQLPVAMTNADDPGEFSSIAGQTIDLGVGGCRVETAERFPVGCDPTVSIDLPDGHRAVGLAAVLQCHGEDGGWDYRLVFLDMGDDDRARIGRLVNAEVSGT